MFSLGIGATGGNFSLGLGETYGAGAGAVVSPPSTGIQVAYGGGYRTEDDPFRRRKRKRRDDLPYSQDPELQAARRELRKLAFYLHPDRMIDLDDKTRREYEELLRLATIEYHAQVERVKRRKKHSAVFDKLRTQLRLVTARLEQLELEMTALRAETQALREEVATLRGVQTTPVPTVVVKSRWAWPLFIGVLIGALATMLVGAWRTRVKPKSKRKRASAQASPSKRKTRPRQQQRPRSPPTSRRQAARARRGQSTA